jgi:hypothetical protein
VQTVKESGETGERESKRELNSKKNEIRKAQKVEKSIDIFLSNFAILKMSGKSIFVCDYQNIPTFLFNTYR